MIFERSHTSLSRKDERHGFDIVFLWRSKFYRPDLHLAYTHRRKVE